MTVWLCLGLWRHRLAVARVLALVRCAQALIDGKVLCVHGGLSPDLRTLDQVPALASFRAFC